MRRPPDSSSGEPNASPSELPSRPYDAIIFDLFGTLIPTGSQSSRKANLEDMARVLGVDPEAFSRRWFESFDGRARGRTGDVVETIRGFVTEMGANPSSESVERAVDLRLRYVRTLFDAGQSSLPALDTLRARGFRLALVSDTSEDTVRLWPSTELATRFEIAVFSCVEGVRKPDRRIFRAVLERLRLEPSACAFVGDGGSSELSGAGAAGLTAFQYCFPEDRGGAYRVDAEVGWRGPRLTEILDLLGPGLRRP
jgi:putative hydrolase of the HAD superfamily